MRTPFQPGSNSIFMSYSFHTRLSGEQELANIAGDLRFHGFSANNLDVLSYTEKHRWSAL